MLATASRRACRSCDCLPCCSQPLLLRRYQAHSRSSSQQAVLVHTATGHFSKCSLLVDVKHICRATAWSGGQSESTGGVSSAPPFLEAAGAYAHALYKFSRPHTMIGTTISVISISLLALEGIAPTAAAGVALSQALVSALLMNVAIVGINQLYDVEIDKINKPYLPLASGELTQQQGNAIVAATAAAGSAIGLASGSVPLILTLGISLLLGVVYSTDHPLMRWKRSPLLAAGCILTVRAFIVQMGFFFHIKQALYAAAATATSASAATATASAAAAAASMAPMLLSSLTPPVCFTLGFMLFFSVVIALFKDIPDTLGDVRAGMRTLSITWGIERVFWLCIWLLTVAYVGAAGFCAMYSPSVLGKAGLAAGHLLMCGLLWQRARKVVLTRPSDLTDCYMFIWKLFYAEYLLIPFLG